MAEQRLESRKLAPTFCVVAYLASIPLMFAQAPDPDLNNDGVVNILDISLVGSCFGQDPATEARCSVADTDGDGDVDMDDLSFVLGSFGQSFPIVSTPPVVTITNPANLSLFSTDPISVAGTVDKEVATVEVNGVAATVNGQTWFAVVPLNEGNNTLTAVAEDAVGNIGTASIQVTRDTTAPQVTIDSPGDGFTTNSASITVAGMINDIVVGTVNGDQAQVTVNGIPAQVANRSFLVAAVALSPGPNPIVAIGTDRAGNTASTRITVTFEELVGEPQINLLSGNNQIGPIGAPLPLPLGVELVDGAGNPTPGETVVFNVTENNGTLSNSPGDVRALAVQTGADGRAQVNWTLGTRSGAGNNMVEAKAVGFSSMAIFTAIALPAAPDKINVDAGNSQTGVVGESLPRPFVAVVTDAGHNRLANVPVTFSVSQGGGNFNGLSTFTTNTDSDGRALGVLTLGPEEGFDNNVVAANFLGNLGFPAAFVASGMTAGDPAETTISGVVLDNSNIPVPGVTMHIEGTTLFTQTDVEGQFVIQPAPVGLVKLLADGSTADRPGTWPSLEFDLVTVPGQDNTVGMPIFLLPLDLSNALFVDETTGGTLTLPAMPGFSLTIEPGSATFTDGSRSGLVSVTVVNADKIPMVPNFGQQPRFIVTIQPAGVLFDPPAPITIPNLDGLPPGQVTELYSFDHDLGQFVSIGTGTVSEDGTVIASDPGVGIIKGGWHCGGDPSVIGTVANCPECHSCQGPPNGDPGGSCEPADSLIPSQTSSFDCQEQICQGGNVVDIPDDTETPTILCKECQGGTQKNRAVCTVCSSPGNVCDAFGLCRPIESICPQLSTTWALSSQSQSCPTNFLSPACGVTAIFRLETVTNTCGTIPPGTPITESVVLNGCGFNDFNVVTLGTCSVGACTDTFSVCFSNSILNIPPISGVPRIPNGTCTGTFTQTLDFGLCSQQREIAFEITGNGSSCTGQVKSF